MVRASLWQPADAVVAVAQQLDAQAVVFLERKTLKQLTNDAAVAASDSSSINSSSSSSHKQIDERAVVLLELKT